MAIDSPVANASVTQPFEVKGWALDRGTVIGPGGSTGVDTVRIYASPIPGSGETPVFLGTAVYGLPRPDLASLYGAQFGPSGFTFDVKGLAVGTYEIVAQARSTVTGTFDGVSRVAVAVGGLVVDRAEVRFDAEVGSGNPVPQSVVLSQVGAGTVNWTAAGDRPWLRVSPASGTGPQLLSIEIVASDPELQTPGTYSGRVTVTSQEAASAIPINVILTVTPKPPPALVVDRAEVRYDVVLNSGSTGPQSVVLSQVRGETISWTAASDRAWLRVSPTFGTGSRVLSIEIVPSDPELQDPGSYAGRVTVTSLDAATSVPIGIIVTVAPKPPRPRR
jgi:hypothetical protein